MDHPGKLKQNQASISYVFPPWSRRKRSPNSLWVWRSGSQVGSARGSLASVCKGNVPPEHHPGRASQWNHQSRSGPAGRSKTIGLTLGGSNPHNLGTGQASELENLAFSSFSLRKWENAAFKKTWNKDSSKIMCRKCWWCFPFSDYYFGDML